MTCMSHVYIIICSLSSHTYTLYYAATTQTTSGSNRQLKAVAIALPIVVVGVVLVAGAVFAAIVLWIRGKREYRIEAYTPTEQTESKIDTYTSTEEEVFGSNLNQKPVSSGGKEQKSVSFDVIDDEKKNWRESLIDYLADELPVQAGIPTQEASI